MIRTVIKSIVATFVCATFVSAQTESDCRSLDFANALALGFEDRDALIAACIDAGRPLVGPFSDNDFSTRTWSTLPVKFTGDLGRLKPKSLSHSCVSPLVADRICLMHADVFAARARVGYCPLERTLEPSNATATNAAMEMVFGRFDLCTSFSKWYLPHEISVEDASSGLVLGYSAGNDEKVYARSITVSASTFDSLRLQDFVFQGNLDIMSSNLESVSVEDTIITGNVNIDDSAIHRFSFKNVWIAGDLNYHGNTQHRFVLEGVTVAGAFRFSGNEFYDHDGRRPIIYAVILPIGSVEIDTKGACSDQECETDIQAFRETVTGWHMAHGERRQQ
ncbi:MAG: hypothetical protein OXQ30_11380 [Boseongicola sp.]|nr:hypothetical protein [Boseongicola sp.]